MLSVDLKGRPDGEMIRSILSQEPRLKVLPPRSGRETFADVDTLATVVDIRSVETGALIVPKGDNLGQATVGGDEVTHFGRLNCP